MREASVSEREFQLARNQYQLFRFSVARPATLYIDMIATDPVNVLLLDSEDRAEYESGEDLHSYTFSWGRRTSLNEAVKVEPGTWYIAVEGRDRSSKGRIKVLQQ
jgi:hypothetical protein